MVEGLSAPRLPHEPVVAVIGDGDPRGPDAHRVLEGHANSVQSVVWSDDRRYALSGANDHTVRLWDVETGRCLRVFSGHTVRVWVVAWSADQRCAFSGDQKGNVRVWDLSEFVTEARAPEVLAPTLPTTLETKIYLAPVARSILLMRSDRPSLTYSASPTIATAIGPSSPAASGFFAPSVRLTSVI